MGKSTHYNILHSPFTICKSHSDSFHFWRTKTKQNTCLTFLPMRWRESQHDGVVVLAAHLPGTTSDSVNPQSLSPQLLSALQRVCQSVRDTSGFGRFLNKCRVKQQQNGHRSELENKPYLLLTRRCSHPKILPSHPLHRSFPANSVEPPEMTKKKFSNFPKRVVATLIKCPWGGVSYLIGPHEVGVQHLLHIMRPSFAPLPEQVVLLLQLGTKRFELRIKMGAPAGWEAQTSLRDEICYRSPNPPIPLPRKSCISPPTSFCSQSAGACPGPAFAPSAWGGGGLGGVDRKVNDWGLR